MQDRLNELLPLWTVCDFPYDMPFLPTRKTLPQNPRSVIVAAFPYLLPEEYYANRNIARYAVVRDYHQVVAARLEQACVVLRESYPNDEFVHYCDHSPLPEVALAEHAGLGVRGRHNLLITEEYGSWVVLGEIVTTAQLPIMQNAKCLMLNCGDCNRCIKACPANALGGEQFDRTQCLSYISQRKEPPSDTAAAQLRAMHSAWGCDICQQVCPHNRKAKIAPLPEFLQGAIAQLTHTTPIEDRAYAWRGQKILGRNVDNLQEE
ncbi:MAG: DUF1730 domain-containing protein [Oscillospiraceae bacterium]|nr:DUF1730 domain-containing protein [Oscillospiraceae bacterium]